jgi:hypothetical protein
MAIAKYNATYQKEGILFMAICPAVVDTAGFEKTCGFFDKYSLPELYKIKANMFLY